MIKRTICAAAAGIILSTPALADDQAIQARRTMQEALQLQAGLPPSGPALPDAATPVATQALQRHRIRAANGGAAGTAEHRATTQEQLRTRTRTGGSAEGTGQQEKSQEQLQIRARLQHEEQANRAALDAARTAGQGGLGPVHRAGAATGSGSGGGGMGEMNGAAMQQRTRSMHPGGMMGSGGSGGGMMPDATSGSK